MFKSVARLVLSLTCVCASSMTAYVSAGHAASTEDMKVQRVTEIYGNVTIDWSEGVVRVIGVGTPPDRGTLSQKQLMAERSAASDAYRQLTDVLSNIRVNSETIVRDYTRESDTLKSYLQALIKGASKLDQRYLDDGTIEVEMAVKLYATKGLSGILQPQKHIKPPIPVTEEPDRNPGDYSGVIIDCRGLGLEPAMSPAVMSQTGGEVYLGTVKVEPDFVITQGIVGYAYSLAQARQNVRVGAKPLIIKGLSATGSFRTDVIISKEDVRRLLGLDASNGVLRQARVILVK